MLDSTEEEIQHDMYDIDEDDDESAAKTRADEVAFKIYCFFNDMEYLRECARRAWQIRNPGKHGLTAAYAATSAAIDLAYKLESDLISECGIEASHDTHLTLLDILGRWKAKQYYATLPASALPTLPPGVTLDDIEHGPRILDDFVMANTATTLRKFASFKGRITKVTWPPPIETSRENLLCESIRPDSAEGNRALEQDRLLAQVLLDQIFLDRYGTPLTLFKIVGGKQGSFHTDSLDLVSRRLESVWRTGKLLVTDVLAAQILLDTHDAFAGNRLYMTQL